MISPLVSDKLDALVCNFIADRITADQYFIWFSQTTAMNMLTISEVDTYYDQLSSRLTPAENKLLKKKTMEGVAVGEANRILERAARGGRNLLS